MGSLNIIKHYKRVGYNIDSMRQSVVVSRGRGLVALLLLCSDVMWLLSFFDSSSQCHGLWYVIVAFTGHTHLLFVILSCLFLAVFVITCWERADLLVLLCVVFPRVFVTFPYIWCPVSGVVLDCIDS